MRRNTSIDLELFNKNSVKDNLSFLSGIELYNIDKGGNINKPLINKTAIYIYMCSSISHSNPKYYVGSTIKLKTRISSHRSFMVNWDKYKENGSGSPVFYRSVLKYGWSCFKLGILEYITLPSEIGIAQKKKIILEKEQFYLDNINPSLNACKIANSPLGIKRNEMFSINLSKTRRGKKLQKSEVKNNNVKLTTYETKLKISLRNKGVSVKVLDKSGNLIHKFPTITKAAEHFGVNAKTISRIYLTGKSFDGLVYEFNPIDNRIEVYDVNRQLINNFYNAKKASLYFNIPKSTLSDYIKSGKLYKGKYYFIKIKKNGSGLGG